jgi:hypothetical protein
MPRLEFEPLIPVFERAKTVHGLDRAATVIGSHFYITPEVTNLVRFCSFTSEVNYVDKQVSTYLIIY